MREHRVRFDFPFEFEAGGHLDGLDMIYFTSDREYTSSEKVVWICHALTGNANPEDWWAQMVGSGKMIDTDRFYVVCAGMLCSPYGSSSPASVNPASGWPFMMDFPETTVRDIVNANILVRRYLGIESIDIMIGPSIGGFQAMEWTVMEPDVIKDAIFIATDSRVTPFMTAFNESQRMALEADPTFRAAADLDGGKAGLACARSMALISYRTFQGYNITQREEDPDTLFAGRAGSYQRYQGKKLIDRFDAYCYWYLTRTLDSHNLGRGRGGVDSALSTIKADCMLVAIDTDMLFPPESGKAIVEKIPNGTYVQLHSFFGHDGFLIENDQLCTAIAPVINKYII